jgi:protein-L-isoaspartate(D-aspartate) O-methyltransferase
MPFQRFPVWMWRNRAVREFVDRLHEVNLGIADPDREGRQGIFRLTLEMA